MKTAARAATLALGAAFGAAACHGDFLTGGELSSDPNHPTSATNNQLFVAVQANTFYAATGELTRYANIFAQHFAGADRYVPVDRYVLSEASTNGAQRQLYGPGGLADVRRLQAGTLAANDTVYLGIAQVQEAMLMAFNADAFGDIVYSHALSGENPPLDPQLVAFDSVQALLGRAIRNLAATGPSNVGPGAADLAYEGDAAKWAALAHTLKARYFMHTAEKRGAAAYDSALAHVPYGIASPEDDYRAVFADEPDQRNPWSIAGDPSGRLLVVPGAWFADTLLVQRHDPRRAAYFTITGGKATGLSAARLAPDAAQPVATAAENLLIWAEAAYRTGHVSDAREKLDAERALYSLPAEPLLLAGNALLAEILTEKYIVDFQLGLEGWKDYRRTCFPNLAPRSTDGTLMPGRLYYDAEERATNTNIPAPGVDPNGLRNAVDPKNTNADAGGGECRAGA